MKKIIPMIVMILILTACGGGGSGGSGGVDLKTFQISIPQENSNASLKYFGSIINGSDIKIDESQGVIQGTKIVIDHRDIPDGQYIYRLTVKYDSVSGILILGHSDRTLTVGAEIILSSPLYSDIDWSIIEANETETIDDAETITDTKDTDGDGVADENDNCPTIANSDQINTDQMLSLQGFPVKADEHGDVCDQDIDGDGRRYVFVSASIGSDANDGTFAAPVSSLGRGTELARQRGDDVIVAAGAYDISSADIVTGVDIYGGFDSSEFRNPLIDPLTKRDIRSKDDKYATYLKSTTSATTIYIASNIADVTIEGFHIYNDAPSSISVCIKLENVGAGINIEGNTILSNESADITRGIVVIGGSPRLDANLIEREGGFDGSENIGIYVDGGDPVIVSNIVRAGASRHATAVAIKDSASIITNNTLDGTSTAAVPLTSTGLVFTNSEPVVVNNVIVAESRGSSDAFAMRCYGRSDEISSSVHVENNILSTFGGVADPAYVDCEGQFHYDAGFTVGSAVVQNNMIYEGLFTDLLSADHSLLWIAGKDAGVDSNVGLFGTVSHDYNFRERHAGAVDIGAKEK